MLAVSALWLALSTLVINEVCYDPVGADGGAEFVELWNAGLDTVSLAGVSLEFANGADDPPAWAVRWTGTDDLRLAPDGVFLIVDRNWTGAPPDAEVTLGLQNGPDAIRLRGSGTVLDLVGWGDLSQPDLSEGVPAMDVSGLSLVRRPDGHDTDDNSADFRGAESTPGAPNWQDLAAELGAVIWSPPSLAAPGAATTVAVEVVNCGLLTIAAARLELVRAAEIWWVPVPSVPATGRVSVSLTLRPRRDGLHAVAARLVVGATDTVHLSAGWLQVGVPDLRLSEVMAVPAQGGEWCEIVNTGSLPRSLAGLQLRDEDGAWRELPAVDVAPGECRVLAQSAEDLEAWLTVLRESGVAASCTPLPVLACPSWPSLNNTAPPSRDFADRLLLGDADGRVLDHVTVGEGTGEAPVNRSLERSSLGLWRPATAVVGGTPGCPPFAPPGLVGDAFLLSPNPFHPLAAPGAVSLCFTVPGACSGWELRVYDLWGQLVRDLGGDDLGPGRREVVWDGRDGGGGVVAVGGYVVVLAWRFVGGAVKPAHRRLVVVREAAS